MRSITTWTFKPFQPLELASRYSDVEGTILLYSGSQLESAENTYLCLFPDEKIALFPKKGVWEELKKQMGPFSEEDSLPKWVGYLAYEMGCDSDPDYPVPYLESSSLGALFYRPTVVIHFNHRNQIATLFASERVSLDKDPIGDSSSQFRISYISDTQESYLEKIDRIKEWILDGEIYQVNLSQEFHLEGDVFNPFIYFKKISELNPAPFSAFLNCGTHSLVSSSPERFLKKEGLKLEARPIKGTKPRGKTEKQDKQNREMLLQSEKERAELLMITDLLRNDLGKVSVTGSVETQKIWECEAYTNVFHLLSIIKSQSHPKLHPLDILKALFPGGSITGCPKLRAMKAIGELEKRCRGIYTGSIGYIASNGDFDFNIAIRTLEIEKKRIKLQLGGGIVIDSDPLKEYEETLHKGMSLFTVLGVEALKV